MAKAGMSKKDIDTANAAIAQINKDVDAKMATADGQAGSDLTVAGKGGGSGGGGTSETSSGAEPPQPSLGVAVDRDQSQVAGMAKSYQGEMIGVSGDSLFQMMDRRYKLHSDRGNFIGGNAPGARAAIGQVITFAQGSGQRELILRACQRRSIFGLARENYFLLLFSRSHSSAGSLQDMFSNS